jgi:pimeloyl-ACP methyl ester carboxylesterase
LADQFARSGTCSKHAWASLNLIPTLLGTDTALNAWDIVSLGYATSLLPDTRGIWSADPDLPILALHLNTRFDIAPLAQYRSLAIVAHSMGGLVVQRALLDNPSWCGGLRI